MRFFFAVIPAHGYTLTWRNEHEFLLDAVHRRLFAHCRQVGFRPMNSMAPALRVDQLRRFAAENLRRQPIWMGRDLVDGHAPLKFRRAECRQLRRDQSRTLRERLAGLVGLLRLLFR